MNRQEWNIIVDTIKECTPDGECDCDGLAECLIETLAKRLGMTLVSYRELADLLHMSPAEFETMFNQRP